MNEHAADDNEKLQVAIRAAVLPHVGELLSTPGGSLSCGVTAMFAAVYEPLALEQMNTARDFPEFRAGLRLAAPVRACRSVVAEIARETFVRADLREFITRIGGLVIARFDRTAPVAPLRPDERHLAAVVIAIDSAFVRAALAWTLRWVEPPGSDEAKRARATTRQERVAAFRQRTRCPVSAIFEAANVHAGDYGRWRRGELPDASIMSENVEAVLAGARKLRLRWPV